MQDFYAVFPYSPGPWNSKLSLHLWDEDIQSQKFSEVFSLKKKKTENDNARIPGSVEYMGVIEITGVDIVDRGESLLNWSNRT